MKDFNKILSISFILTAVLLLTANSFAQDFAFSGYTCIEQTKDGNGKLKSSISGSFTLTNNGLFFFRKSETETITGKFTKDAVGIINLQGDDSGKEFYEAVAYPSKIKPNRYHFKLDKNKPLRTFTCDLQQDEKLQIITSTPFYALLTQAKPLSNSEEAEIADEFASIFQKSVNRSKSETTVAKYSVGQRVEMNRGFVANLWETAKILEIYSNGNFRLEIESNKDKITVSAESIRPLTANSEPSANNNTSQPKNTDKEISDKLISIIAPIREQELDIETNPDYQDENKLIPAAAKFIKETANAVKQIKAIKNETKNLSSLNVRLINENIEFFEQRLGRFNNSDFNTRIADYFYQNKENFDAVQFAMKAIEQEGNLPQKSAAKVIYEEIKAKTNPTIFAFWNLSDFWRTQNFVGYIIEYNYAKWNNMPYFIFRGAKLGEYSEWNYAKKLEAANKFQRDSIVVIRNNETKMFEIFQALAIDNTTINSTIASSPFTSTLKPTTKFTFNYESIRMNATLALIAPPKGFYADYDVVDIIDRQGLSLVTIDNLPEGRSGTKTLLAAVESELSRNYFDEAKATYLYFDRITSPTPNLENVKTTRRSMLTKMYKSSPILRKFVEEEMTRLKYADPERKMITGK